VSHLLLDDGYLIYCSHLREIEHGTFNQADLIKASVRNDSSNSQWGESLRRPNPKELGKFEEFLVFCRNQGIEVRVMFLPCHPDYERQLFTAELTQARSALSQSLRRMCGQYGAMYRDFTKLATYDGDPDQFYDSVHQTPVNTRKMINVLFGIGAADVVADLPTDREILKHLPSVTSLTTE
jgi:hypothetical protein